MNVSLSYDELRKLRNQLSDHQAIRDLILSHMATLDERQMTGTEVWIKGMLTDLVEGEPPYKRFTTIARRDVA